MQKVYPGLCRPLSARVCVWTQTLQAVITIGSTSRLIRTQAFRTGSLSPRFILAAEMHPRDRVSVSLHLAAWKPRYKSTKAAVVGRLKFNCSNHRGRCKRGISTQITAAPTMLHTSRFRLQAIQTYTHFSMISKKMTFFLSCHREADICGFLSKTSEQLLERTAVKFYTHRDGSGEWSSPTDFTTSLRVIFRRYVLIKAVPELWESSNVVVNRPYHLRSKCT